MPDNVYLAAAISLRRRPSACVNSNLFYFEAQVGKDKRSKRKREKMINRSRRENFSRGAD